MTNQTEQGAALPDKPNYHPWSQLSEFEPSGNSGEFTDAQADAIARIAFARHTGRTEWEGAQRWVLEAIKAAARPTPEGCTSDDEAENFAMSKFASRADRDAAMLRELASLRAANSELAAAAIVRDGYALVPLEPTEAMVDAFENAMEAASTYVRNFPAAYRAMVAAATAKDKP